MRFVYSSNDVRSTRFFVYTYNNNNFRIVKVKSCMNEGFEPIDKQENFVDYNSDEVKRVSLSRTKRNIREIALCNDFEYFVTLTIDSEKCDRYSLDIVQDNLKKLLKKIKRTNKDFRYIFITERHKDNAFHFHGLVGGYNNNDLILNDYGYLSSKIFSQNMGFNSFSKIKDYTKCCNYITKYISKDCVKNSHNQIYISSRGLKKASKEEFSFIDFKPSFTNDFCEILDIDLSKMSYNEKFDIFCKFNKGK